MIKSMALAYFIRCIVLIFFRDSGLYPSTWSQVALENLFLHPGAPTNSSPSAASSSMPASSVSGHTSRGAIIAGATIGGLVIAILPFILLFCFFRRRHHDRPNSIMEMHAEDIKHEMYAGGHTREPSAYGANRSGYGRGRSRGRSRGRFVVELDAGGRTPRRSYQTEWADEKKGVREEVRDLGTESPTSPGMESPGMDSPRMVSPELLRPPPSAARVLDDRRSPRHFGSPDSISPESEEWTSEKPWDEKYIESRSYR